MQSKKKKTFAIKRINLRNIFQLLVLPIQHADGGELSEEEIRNIAGRENEENILTDALEGGFEALNEEFARELAGYLCPVPCANPFHSHPDEIPSRLAGYVNDIRKKKWFSHSHLKSEEKLFLYHINKNLRVSCCFKRFLLKKEEKMTSKIMKRFFGLHLFLIIYR